MPQNLNQTRVVDPILSGHARGWRQATLVGRALFPIASVPAYGGKVIEFDKSAFRLVNSRRAPGAATKRITYGHEGKPYAVVPSALEAQVPREQMKDASAVPGINLAQRAVNIVLRSLNLEHEYSCAQIANNAANYDSNHKVTLTGTDRWTSPDSTPVDDVLDAREAIRTSIGMYPNTMEISARALTALKRHPDILARAPTNNGVVTVTMELLRAVFEIQNIVVGAATISAGDAGDTLGDVWGENVVLAYVSESGGGITGDAEERANNEEPSYGYTYEIDDHPMIEVPYWDNSTKSWVYGVSWDNSPQLTGMTAGFLIVGAGTPQ